MTDDLIKRWLRSPDETIESGAQPLRSLIVRLGAPPIRSIIEIWYEADTELAGGNLSGCVLYAAAAITAVLAAVCLRWHYWFSVVFAGVGFLCARHGQRVKSHWARVAGQSRATKEKCEFALRLAEESFIPTVGVVRAFIESVFIAERVCSPVMHVLTKSLPALSDEAICNLDDHNWQTLYRCMHQFQEYPELAIAVIQLISRGAHTPAYSEVQKIAKSGTTQVHREAAECLKVLSDRIQADELNNRLLRPAEPSGLRSTSLLRPVRGLAAYDGETLLHSVESDN